MRKLLLALPLALAACGGSTSSPGQTTTPVDPTRPDPALLCDGSSHVRLVVRHEYGGGPPVAQPGDALLGQNAGALLTIDGQCRYVAYETAIDVRTGTLTPDEASSIESDLQLAKWSAWPGSYPALGCDEAAMAMRFDAAKIGFVDGCSGSTAATGPFDARAMHDRAMEWITKLAREGAEVTGAVRALVYEPSTSPVSATPATWPIARDPSSIATSEASAAKSMGTLFTGSDAQALRALRGGRDALSVDARAGQGATFRVIVRDEIPGAGADGAIDLGL